MTDDSILQGEFGGERRSAEPAPPAQACGLNQGADHGMIVDAGLGGRVV
jgi:hypothetical protein